MAYTGLALGPLAGDGDYLLSPISEEAEAQLI